MYVCQSRFGMCNCGAGPEGRDFVVRTGHVRCVRVCAMMSDDAARNRPSKGASQASNVNAFQCCPGLPCQFLGIPHVPVCGYMLPNLSPSSNLYKYRVFTITMGPVGFLGIVTANLDRERAQQDLEIRREQARRHQQHSRDRETSRQRLERTPYIYCSTFSNRLFK